MGVNGWLRTTVLWSVTNSANDKTFRVKFGGTTFLGILLTTSTHQTGQCNIRNRGALNSQIGPAINAGAYSASTGVMVTGAIDTSLDQNLTFTSELESGAESITIEAYSVELLRGP